MDKRQSLVDNDSGVNLGRRYSNAGNNGQSEGFLDGAGDEMENGKNGKTQGRRWFKSLGRTNSVRQ